MHVLDPNRLLAAALELGQYFHLHCVSPQQLRRQSAEGLRLNEEVSTSDPTDEMAALSVWTAVGRATIGQGRLDRGEGFRGD